MGAACFPAAVVPFTLVAGGGYAEAGVVAIEGREDQPMDQTTQKVKDMYSQFPYPSPQKGRKKYRELANLLRLFCHEVGYDMTGKRVLDAGTGSGHRLLEAAALYKNTHFVGVDISEASLSVAKATAADGSIDNVEFRSGDLMGSTESWGKFDVVLSMGVLHHTSVPSRALRNIVSNMDESGILFLYLYGRWGARERMRRKAIVSLLLKNEAGDFDKGIRMVKDLGFELSEYGWNVGSEDEATVNTWIVDSYLNVNDILYDIGDVLELMEGSGLYGFSSYGITVQDTGYLFDVHPERPHSLLAKTTKLDDVLKTEFAREAFGKLSLEERYRLVDLVYQPNGYTLFGFSKGAVEQVGRGHRIMQNAFILSEHPMSNPAQETAVEGICAEHEEDGQ